MNVWQTEALEAHNRNLKKFYASTSCPKCEGNIRRVIFNGEKVTSMCEGCKKASANRSKNKANLVVSMPKHLLDASDIYLNNVVRYV